MQKPIITFELQRTEAEQDAVTSRFDQSIDLQTHAPGLLLP